MGETGLIKFAGIKEPYKLGKYSVEQNARVLQRYRFLHESLMRIQAGQLPAREDWDLKIALCKHMYEDAEAAQLLRKRIPQLRTSSAVLNREPDASLALLADELLHARNDLELAEGLFGLIKPALAETYKRHIASTQQIVDQPTIRVLQAILVDLEEQLAWGTAFLAELRQSGLFPDPGKFISNLSTIIDAAGGLDGLGPRTTSLPGRSRSSEAYSLPLKSARDPRKMGPTTLVRTGVVNPPEDPVQRRAIQMMRVRQEEMTACELVAGVLYSQRNMPWDFYYDLARHVWDEARHALFGQAALESEGYDWRSRPQYTSDYDINAPKIPAVQYAWLSIGIEEGAMISNGKKAEYEFCRDQAKHPLFEQFQDYDWADEVVHANFGRRWSPDLIGDEIGFVREIARKELEQFFGAVRKAEEEWVENSP